MGKVSGVKEKLHYPLYDAHIVKVGSSFTEGLTDSRLLRFFVDVQQKTRLETNLQASSVLPSMNTFEARALRVVASPVRNQKTTTGTPPTSTVTPVPDPNVGLETAKFLTGLIYQSVTSLLVGEKTMVEMPTFYFPSGAGVHTMTGHGEPDPMATFRFSEAVMIEPQQNFRVEVKFPDVVPADVEKAAGPLRVWVVLDGYMTRDVQ